MGEPQGVSQLEITRRFLLRFADLMSNGANSANLLLAAELLDCYVHRASAAEERLTFEQAHSAELESKLAALSSDQLARLPRSMLQITKSQFELLSSEFEKSGNLVSQAMCEASASALGRYLGSSNDPTSQQASASGT